MAQLAEINLQGHSSFRGLRVQGRNKQKISFFTTQSLTQRPKEQAVSNACYYCSALTPLSYCFILYPNPLAESESKKEAIHRRKKEMFRLKVKANKEKEKEKVSSSDADETIPHLNKLRLSHSLIHTYRNALPHTPRSVRRKPQMDEPNQITNLN